MLFLQQRISLYGEFTVSQLEISRTLLNSGLLTIDTFILPLLKFLLYHNTFTLVIWSLYFIHLLTHLVHAKLLIWIIKRMKVSHCPQHCNVTSFNVLEIAVFPTRAITTFASSCVHLNKLLFTFYSIIIYHCWTDLRASSMHVASYIVTGGIFLIFIIHTFHTFILFAHIPRSI